MVACPSLPVGAAAVACPSLPVGAAVACPSLLVGAAAVACLSLVDASFVEEVEVVGLLRCEHSSATRFFIGKLKSLPNSSSLEYK